MGNMVTIIIAVLKFWNIF